MLPLPFVSAELEPVFLPPRPSVGFVFIFYPPEKRLFQKWPGESCEEIPGGAWLGCGCSPLPVPAGPSARMAAEQPLRCATATSSRVTRAGHEGAQQEESAFCVFQDTNKPGRSAAGSSVAAGLSSHEGLGGVCFFHPHGPVPAPVSLMGQFYEHIT